MKTDNRQNIPILNDRLEQATHSNTDSTLQQERSNPFLPYETLERLAKERVEFQKQLAEFGQYFEFPSPAELPTSTHSKDSSIDHTTKTESIEALIHSITQSVLNEYAAEIEMEIYRRVKTKLLGA